MAIANKLLYENPHPNPLGNVPLAAMVKDSSASAHEPNRPMRVFGKYAAVYILEGAIWYRDANGIACEMTAGDLFFVFPELPHGYGPRPNQTFSQLWIQFEGPIFDVWRREGVIHPGNFIHQLQPIPYWIGRFEQMFASLPVNADPSPMAACALQQLLAEAFMHEKRSAVSPDVLTWLDAAERELTKCQRADEFDVHNVAREMHMSYANFRKKFTRLAGMPPGKYFMTMLMRRASRLLHESQMTNKQLADRLGICNEFHFVHCFKQTIGLPPQEFRRLGFGNATRSPGP